MKREITVIIFQAKAFDTIEEMKQVDNIPIQVKTINDDLVTYREIIDCDYIEITGRKIGKGSYFIVCDESGQYKDDVIFTVVNRDGSYLDVPGTIIITGPADTRGDLTSLTNEDITNIMSKICVTTQTVGDKQKYVPVIAHDGSPMF